MASERFSAESIARLLRRQQVATMDELKDALGSRVDMTVFRKMRRLPYLSSYSHGGRYYTLREVAGFDERGLWTCRNAHFSQFGSLVDTVETFVNRAARGYVASELTTELQVEAKEPLLKLVRQRRLAREACAGLYVYCLAEAARRRQQLLARQLPAEDGCAVATRRGGGGGEGEVDEEIGQDPHKVAKGRRELLERDVDVDRLRRPGGGRPSIEKKRQRSSKKSRHSSRPLEPGI